MGVAGDASSHGNAQVLAEAWVDAYNAKDYPRLRGLLADDFVLIDHGIGLRLEGGSTFVEGIQQVAETDIPDRRLTVDRILVDGAVAVMEGSWQGTVLVERWGKPAGSIRKHRSCTLLETSGDKIIRMTDYTCDQD